MVSKINRAVICLRISQAIYGLLAAIVAVIIFWGWGSISDDQEGKTIGLITMVITFFMLAGVAVFIHFVIRDLRLKKFWAWVAAICLFGLYLTSIFFPLGLLGFIFLLSESTRKEFGMGKI